MFIYVYKFLPEVDFCSSLHFLLYKTEGKPAQEGGDRGSMNSRALAISVEHTLTNLPVMKTYIYKYKH